MAVQKTPTSTGWFGGWFGSRKVTDKDFKQPVIQNRPYNQLVMEPLTILSNLVSNVFQPFRAKFAIPTKKDPIVKKAIDANGYRVTYNIWFDDSNGKVTKITQKITHGVWFYDTYSTPTIEESSYPKMMKVKALG